MKFSLCIFLKKTLVFPILLFSSISLHFSLKFSSVQLLSHVRLFTQEDFLNPACYSLELCIQLGTSFPFPLPFTSLLFSAICKASLANHFAFLHFFSLGWFWSLRSVQCYKPLFIIHQTVYLPEIIFWIYSSPPLYNHKRFYLGHTWMALWFSLFSSTEAWILQ